MKSPAPIRPSLTPSFPLSSQETSRVATNATSPEPHLGWHSRGYLPHWDHPGMIQSVTFRLGDSLPASVVETWRTELGLLQRKRSRAGSAAVPVASFAFAPSSTTNRRDGDAPSEVELRRRIEKYLDAGHGQCWLRRPDIAGLTEDALLHFDGQRYRLLSWCIMPNHVHVLIETQEGFPLDRLVHSWKSFTGHKANSLLQRQGEFWQRDYHDRYVRNAEHYEQVVAYIEENPVKAGLAKVKIDWPRSSARFRNPGSAAVPAAS